MIPRLIRFARTWLAVGAFAPAALGYAVTSPTMDQHTQLNPLPVSGSTMIASIAPGVVFPAGQMSGTVGIQSIAAGLIFNVGQISGTVVIGAGTASMGTVGLNAGQNVIGLVSPASATTWALAQPNVAATSANMLILSGDSSSNGAQVRLSATKTGTNGDMGLIVTSGFRAGDIPSSTTQLFPVGFADEGGTYRIPTGVGGSALWARNGFAGNGNSNFAYAGVSCFPVFPTAGLGGTRGTAQTATPFQTAGMSNSSMTATGFGGVAADVRSVGAAGPGTTTVFTIVTGGSGGVTITVDSSMAGGNEIDVCLEPASGAAGDEIKFSFDTPSRTSSCADAALNGWPVTHAVFDQAVGANAALCGPAKKSNLNLKVGDKIYFVNVGGTQPVHVWVSQTR